MEKSKVKPRNIAIFCDGTGNKFGRENSNVVKLYSCLTIDEEQLAYYHPGVGTMGDPNRSSYWGKKLSVICGLAFGYGFKENLSDAYRYLMENYRDGDRIYLFGFSRGAYTVRALSGVLYMYGLLCPGNEGHLPYLIKMFSDESRLAYRRDKKEGGRGLSTSDESDAFRETFCRVVPIHFIGIWDTVSSIGWIYDPVKLLFDGQNPILRKGRHAISLDERRCFYQTNLWGPPLPLHETPVLRAAGDSGQSQDIVQAWFAGVHSDVGGSYPQPESAPAMDGLRWILEEAEADGLVIDPERRSAIWGEASTRFPVLAKTNQLAHPPGTCLHQSFTWRWWILEIFPHKYFDGEGRLRWRFAPWPRRREVPEGSLIHPSLRERLATDSTYKPKNLRSGEIRNFRDSPLAIAHDDVRQRLASQNFGIYRKSGIQTSSLASTLTVGMVLIASIGVFVYHLKR